MGPRHPGLAADWFVEGPCFDAAGNFYIVAIPKVAPGGEWSRAIEYAGWPIGLKMGGASHILVADYRHALMQLEAMAAMAGRMLPLVLSRNSE